MQTNSTNSPQAETGAEPTEQTPDFSKRFGRLLCAVFRQWRRQFDQSYQKFGLSEATGAPLITLYDADIPLRQKDLAQAVGVDSSSLFRVLNTLRDKGLIEWESDPNDGRAKLIALTQSGRSLAETILHRSLELEALIIAQAEAEDFEKARTFLTQTLQRLEALRN